DSYIAFVLFSTISNFYNNFSSSFGSGMVSFCGNNMGRKNEIQFKKHVKIAFVLLWSFYLLISLIIIILSSSVYSLLVSDVDIIDLMTNTS
ncbi:MATE family efflux transporter, partial [Pseudomonas syringae]|uniref:MATE family efflux transporter n=1 Tax=Pseudomonas syringae TaxID=317 RepID=UPI0034D64F34